MTGKFVNEREMYLKSIKLDQNLPNKDYKHLYNKKTKMDVFSQVMIAKLCF